MLSPTLRPTLSAAGAALNARENRSHLAPVSFPSFAVCLNVDLASADYSARWGIEYQLHQLPDAGTGNARHAGLGTCWPWVEYFAALLDVNKY
jgi:hypothetical protein